MSEMPEKNSQVEHFQVNDLRFDYFLFFLWLCIFQGFTVYTFLVKVIYLKDKFSKMSRHI